MRGQLGFFGGSHANKGDNRARFTNVTCNNDHPPDYDPGNFYLLYLGVFIVMDPLMSINFCGVRFHGGSPPTAPPGQEPVDWAYRFVVVSYPPRKMTNGDARYAFGANTNDKPFMVSPEVLNVE